MRKSYGPTGISAFYTFEKFKVDIQKIGARISYNEFTTNADHLKDLSEDDLRAFYEKADSVGLYNPKNIVTVYAGNNEPPVGIYTDTKDPQSLESVEYAVLTATLGGWEDCWTEVDEAGVSSCRYLTKIEAQIEINELIDDIQNEIDLGDRDPEDAYHHENYRIAKVINGVIQFDELVA